MFIRFVMAWLPLCALLLVAPVSTLAQMPALLPPERAFAAEAIRQDDSLAVTLTVKDGYYVYRNSISFKTAPLNLTSNVLLPDGQIHTDPYVGKQIVLTGKNHIMLTLTPNAPAQFVLEFRLQGCAQGKACYPPYTHQLIIDSRSRQQVENWLRPTSNERHVPVLSQENAFQTKSTTAVLLAFFASGLGMAFTACMYPLLPIISSLIAGQRRSLTRARGAVLAFAYVQGLALTYTVVGVVAGITGSLLTVWLQKPIIILTTSILLALLALSMFNVFPMQLPAALQSRLSSISNRLIGGHIISVFMMGILSALIVGPCVAPPLALALGYIGSTGNALLGGVALYCMGLGLGLPLLIVGALGGHFLPRAGEWMNTIRALFGILILALAIGLATPFLSSAVILLLWAALLIGTAVFLHATDPLPYPARPLQRLGKAFGILLLLLGAAQVAGALLGSPHPLRPFQSLTHQTTTVKTPVFRNVQSAAELKELVASAGNRPVILEFYANWCAACKAIEDTTFTVPEVAGRMQSFLLLRADVTRNTEADSELLKQFGLFGPPGIILFDSKGKEAEHIIGYIDSNAFLAKLNLLLSQ